MTIMRVVKLCEVDKRKGDTAEKVKAFSSDGGHAID
jgi:hypothetical protein